ncbi:MAG: protein kinase [Eubacterium sp.]|nr:protein kinase [Eubacterium sp.]
MSDIQKVITKYLDTIYEIVPWSGNNDRITLIRSRVDGRLYILKNEGHYDMKVYSELKKQEIPGIPKMYELIQDNNNLLVIEEFIEDDGVYERLSDEKSICEAAIMICDILTRLHNLKPPIIHRDIKPENILVSGSGVYLIDYNISRAFRGEAGQDTFIMGTQGYAAPEQFGFSESDARTDIYGLGATIKTLKEKAGIESYKLDRIIDKATSIDPRNRYQNAEEMKRALKAQKGYSVLNVLKKYAIPGYRSGNFIVMFFATTLYAFWGYICFAMEMTPNPYHGIYASIYNWLGRLYLLTTTFLVIAFSGNYLGVREKLFRKCNMEKLNIFIKILIIALMDAILIVLIFAIYAFIAYAALGIS